MVRSHRKPVIDGAVEELNYIEEKWELSGFSFGSSAGRVWDPEPGEEGWN